MDEPKAHYLPEIMTPTLVIRGVEGKAERFASSAGWNED